MWIENKNGEFNVNASQYNYLLHTFIFNEIDQNIINKSNFINSTYEYKKADEEFSKLEYKEKLRSIKNGGETNKKTKR